MSEGEAKETVFVHCTPAVRAKWHRARFLASRQEGHPIPAWMVAGRIAAEVLSAIPLDEPAEEIASANPEEAESANGCATHVLGAEGIDSGGPGPSSPAPVSAAAESANECATQGDLPDARLGWLRDGLDEADVFELGLRAGRPPLAALSLGGRARAVRGEPVARLRAGGTLWRRRGF